MREQGSGSRRVVETALEKAGFKLKSFKNVMDLDSTEAIKSAVEVGLGIGFVSRWAISKELELGALKVAEVAVSNRPAIFPSSPVPARSRKVQPRRFRTFALERARLLANAPRKPLAFWPIPADKPN